jgi:hypothetical protein
MSLWEDSLRERYLKLNVANASRIRLVEVILIRLLIDLASPNLCESVTVRIRYRGAAVLDLRRNCLTFEFFLVDFLLADVDFRISTIYRVFAFACFSMVKFDGDHSQVFELRFWFGGRSILSCRVRQR